MSARRTISLALISIALLPAIACPPIIASSPPSAEDLLARQQAYFNSIKSIEFYSTFTMQLSPRMVAEIEEQGNPPRTKIEQKLHLIVEGDKFRAEATLTDFDTQQPFTAIHAFDGESYQLLHLPQEPSYPVLMPEMPYFVLDPLVSIYALAFPQGGEGSIHTLRGDAFWSLFADMVIACEPARLDDSDAVKLTLSVPSRTGEGSIPVEMFFSAETDYAPVLSWRATPFGPEADGGEIFSEMHIAATAPVETNAGTIYIPTRLESGTYRAGDPYTPTEIIVIDPSTLKVNHDIDDSVFTLPGARVYRTLSAPPPETNPDIARAVIDAIYADSLDQLKPLLDPFLLLHVERMPDWMRAGTPQLLQDRFGSVEGVEFIQLGEPDNPMVRESIWTVRADGRDFQMKLWFVQERVSGLFFRYTEGQEWSSYPACGLDFVADEKVPPGW